MAKLSPAWIGNSLNLKMIINDNNNNNILNNVKFIKEKKEFNFSENEKGEQAIAGIINHIQDFVIFYAPNVNSYKRLKEEKYALNWNKLGYLQENCGINLMKENNEMNAFFSLPGSDANPYFTLFALLNSVYFLLI